MGFAVLPALVPDIEAVYDVYFSAFQDNAVTRAFFPSASAEQLVDSKSEFRKTHASHVLQYWHTSTTQYTIKCVDTETGAVVGMALWDCYITASDWKKGEITWLEGKERERAEALVQPLWSAREKLWLNEKYLYCHVIAVDPKFQRRGIGELLFNYGTNIAHQAQLPIYIESSAEAVRLYEKMGCKKLKERTIHRADPSRKEESNGIGEDQGINLYVWTPDNDNSRLPRAVELAL
ncbi:hypothetical protein ACN47E_000107 [Coniothyrium glycines]